VQTHPSEGEGSRHLRHLRLVIEYAGDAFAGWQIQPDARTVQGELERALAAITRETIRVHGASRTDAGVHALGQVVSFSTSYDRPLRRLIRGLNAVLPDDVAVVEAEEVAPDFHARFSAQGKRYRYRILRSATPSPLEATRALHEPRALDLQAMQVAADALTGRYDFKAFVSRPDGDGDCTRTLFRVDVASRPLERADGELVTVEVEGDGFLYKMVRTIVGTLLQVGRGERPPASLPGLLQCQDRRQAGPTAPAHGLTLVRVFYETSESTREGRAVADLEPQPTG
jgi:tRNA pseudouridine38-40 synthase